MDRITMKKKESLGFFDTNPSYEDWSRIGSFSKLQVWVDDSMDESLWVEVVDTSVVHGRSPQRVKRVLEIQLSKTEFKAWHIDITRLDHKYAGRGIAAKAYRYIIKKLGITLQAGSAQSKGGRKVWFDLAQRQDLNVYAKTKYGQSNIVGIDCEEREVWLPKKEIYDGNKEMYVFASEV
jgi:hypothetical protein